jgi:hypothetical protein
LTTCERPTCPGRREIITLSGVCETCPFYEIASADKLRCVRPQCDIQLREFLTPEGNCDTCPNHEITDENGTGCIRSVCPTRSILKSDGTCEVCTDYLRPKDKLTCSLHPCDDNSQSIDRFGQCHESYRERYERYFGLYSEIEPKYRTLVEECRLKDVKIERLENRIAELTLIVENRDAEIARLNGRVSQLNLTI